MMTPRWAADVMKRIATGRPVPSPKEKTEPPAVVIRRVPRRTNRLSNKSSSRSIGRPHHVQLEPDPLPSPQPDQVRRTSPIYALDGTILDQSPGFPAMRRPVPRHGLTFARLWVKQRIRMVARAQGAGREVWLPVTERPTRGAFGCGAAAVAAMLCLWGAPAASAQSDNSPPQSSVRGENFSAKPAPALFAADCTGGGCHKGPQGLAKNQSQSGLASFLREHYTNSRESAAALSNYLLRLPAGPAQPEPRAARPPTRAARPARRRGQPVLVRSGPGTRPNEARTPRQQQQQGTRPPHRRARRRVRATRQRLRQPRRRLPRWLRPRPSPPGLSPRRATSADVSSPRQRAAAPPAPEAAPPPPPPAPPPPQFDIFD